MLQIIGVCQNKEQTNLTKKQKGELNEYIF